MSELSGSVIDGKYELLRQVGHGGMGDVYEAKNLRTLKRCAVKLLTRHRGDADSEKRFVREARAGGLIESEHVVAAFDSGIDAAGRPYYVMDYLEGEDLERTLRRLGPLAPNAACKVVLQAALGLAKAHDLGIVHRDVKPANLFLVPGDDDSITVKVLDFGVAKVKSADFDESSAAMTRTGSMLGTPAYMSPEQIRRASKIDASADVWSLGVVLFECLSGRHPWDDSESLGTLMAAILTADVPQIQDRAPWVRPELADIVDRAVSRNPARRLRTAGELRDALRAVVPEGPRLTRAELTSAGEAERASIAPRKHRSDALALDPTLRESPLPAAYRSVATTVRRRPTFTALGAFASVLVAGALLITLSRNAGSDTPLKSTSHAAAPAEHPEPARDRFYLEVAPPDAAATVNGTSVPVVDGKILIEGALGSAHAVRLEAAGNTLEARVALTAEGLIPARLDAAPARPPSSGTAGIPGPAPVRPVTLKTHLPKRAPAAAVSPPAAAMSASDPRPSAPPDTSAPARRNAAAPLATPRLDDKFH